MPVLSSSIHPGLLNLPGTSPASKNTAEELLKVDEESHHCFFRAAGLHNHTSHHILAAYDLGAPAPLIKAIYDEEKKIQRPIDLKLNGVTPEAFPNPGEIKDDNWTNYLGDAKAYSAYLAFFSEKIASGGVTKTFEDYILSPAANGNGSDMLYRLVAGAFHPFIQVGYGLEFNCKIEVAAGLAQAAVHDARSFVYVPPDKFVDSTSTVNGTQPLAKGRQPPKGPSILSILRQIYDSPKLTPVLPYEQDSLLSKRVMDFIKAEGGASLAELQRIISHFDPGNTHEEIDSRIEELIFASTLLLFGTGKPNRKPRLDFFLMHLLTSCLFLPSFFKYINKVQDKRVLFRTYIQPWGTVLMTRGRPRIDPSLLMSYTDNPTPPNFRTHPEQPSSLNAESANPWPAMIADVIHAPDAHTVKSLRTLIYGATKYGTLSKGDVIGAWGPDGKETHPGISEVDGTVFIRAAGVLMDTLGWVTHGQREGNWDRSALGWDDAWKGED
ncbi:hypothetical protein K439DRAFT_1630110 [Ramaria rubella]|nr:hypothetical protein K439DRAFT_1630110 [Ramaria rubella]